MTEIGGDGGGFLQIMQVPALDIFDKGQNSGVLLIDLHFQTRNCLQSRQLGCPEAALWRTVRGWMIPWRRMDSASSARGPGANSLRGWWGLGAICSTGSQRTCVSNMRGTS